MTRWKKSRSLRETGDAKKEGSRLLVSPLDTSYASPLEGEQNREPGAERRHKRKWNVVKEILVRHLEAQIHVLRTADKALGIRDVKRIKSKLELLSFTEFDGVHQVSANGPSDR